MAFTILVCGDRKWTNNIAIRRELEKYRDRDVLVITGGCSGADTIAENIAKEFDYETKIYMADWDKYKNAAGPIRNSLMLQENKIDLVIAFHSNISQSKGTKDMVTKARKKEIRVEIYKE